MPHTHTRAPFRKRGVAAAAPGRAVSRASRILCSPADAFAGCVPPPRQAVQLSAKEAECAQLQADLQSKPEAPAAPAGAGDAAVHEELSTLKAENEDLLVFLAEQDTKIKDFKEKLAAAGIELSDEEEDEEEDDSEDDDDDDEGEGEE